MKTIRGLITKSTGSWYQVLDTEHHTFYEARIRGKFKLKKTRLTNPIAVGDWVSFQLEPDGVAWITEIEPRKNYLIRKSVNLSKEAHIIASNIDIACLLYTLKSPETSLGFLDRFLVCCETYNIKPLILFNKIDILDEEELSLIADIRKDYENIGYQTLDISSRNGTNIEQLKSILKDKISVFFGHSGCGKSTLANTLQPSLNLKTSEISDYHLKGKHTTTFAQMHFWDFGGSIIDTPGVREFAMIDVQKEEIQHYFPEIFEAKESCKFHNCMHLNEPKCEVITKVENGTICTSRYATYLKLLEEAEEVKSNFF